ncbi:MAG: ribosome small subunit-dependent GTPase A [Paracoccaceae bacterium]
MKPTETTLPDMGWTQFFQSQIEIEEYDRLTPVRVTEVHRNAIETIGQSGQTRLPMTGELVDHGVAVGDWIVTDKNTDLPVRVLTRKTLLQRRASGDDPSAQLIAANVDTLFIVSSCNADFNIARLERYMALAHQAEIEPVIVLTKADLCDEPEEFRQRAQSGLQGVVVETVVATDPKVAKQLEPWCSKGLTVALLGSSGVGKSTLINALTGAGVLTQDIREDDAKGRHTTTRRSMHRTPTGGWVIDTPGMRSLRLTDVAEGVDMVFADVSELVQYCKFRDCKHETEPGCAIQSAIAAGDLDPARLVRWQKLQREDARHTETLAQGRERTRSLNKKYAGGKARLKAKKGDFYQP